MKLDDKKRENGDKKLIIHLLTMVTGGVSNEINTLAH